VAVEMMGEALAKGDGMPYEGLSAALTGEPPIVGAP
jgi:hypothetical protein